MIVRTVPVLFAAAVLASASPAGAAPGGAEAAAEQGPKELIAARYKDIDAIIKTDQPEDAMREQIKALMEGFVDYRELSRLTIKEQWPELDAARRDEFVGLFKQLIARSYARRFKRDVALTVTFHGDAELRRGRARVKTTVESGGTTVDVEYRLYRPEGEAAFRVYDIVIDDVSLMRNYRSQFQKIARQDGVDALFRRLREKVAAGEE